MISVLIPIFNEEKSLSVLVAMLREILKDLDKEYEIIFLDDGSTDNSLQEMEALAAKDKKIKIYSFRKNQGKSEVLTFGFQKASGDYIVTMDGDLEDKPSELPKLYEKIQEGYDIVSGWRKDRKHKWYMVFPSRVFNFLARTLWDVKLHDYNCGYKIYTKAAAKSLRLYGGLHRFIPLLAAQQGFTITEVPIEHTNRKYGKSKYGFSKVWKELPDMFTMLFLSRYSKRPLHFFGTIGMLLLVVGIVILSYLSVLHFLGEAIGRRPLLLFGMLLVISGFQIIFTGFLADFILNLAHQERHEQTLDESVKLRYTNTT